MEYNKIFKPDTLEKLNKRSQENLKKMVGNKTLMQTMISSTKLLQEIMAVEAPYKEQLEQLAIQMAEDMYPIILEDNINLDAKIVSMGGVNKSLDEIKLKENNPEAKRRVINGITQGAALHGTFSFYMFKEYLDAIDDTLIEKYNQLMKEVFGIYDDDNAIAMFLQMIAQGQKMGGGSSKVVINEIKINKPISLAPIKPLLDYYLNKEKQGFDALDEDGLRNILTNHIKGWKTPLIKTNVYNLDIEEIISLAMSYLKSKGSNINEIKINKPKKYFTINNDEDRNKFKQLATKNNWINYTGDMAGDFYYPNGSQLYLFNGYIHNKTEELTENNTQQGPTIQARAICFPMLVHEIIKGLYELVSLQGFSGTKDQNQAVVDKVDKLENEPHDLKYGKFIYNALNDIYAESGYNDSRIREFFFAEVYQLGDREFVEFIENALNDELTSSQQSWIKQTLKEIQMDLRSDDFDATGLDEIKINHPNTLNINNLENYNSFERGKNIKETISNFIKNNPYFSEKQIVTILQNELNLNGPSYIRDNLRRVDNLSRKKFINPLTKKQVFVYYIK